VKVVVTGATGYVGRPLVEALLASGAAVTALTRSAARATPLLPGATVVEGDLQEPGPWTAALAGATAVVHLAGELIAGKRWDARQKQAIRDSRVETTARLVDAIGALAVSDRPRALVCASGIDYYGFALRDRSSSFTAEDDDVVETDPPGDGFLSRVCRDWEAEAQRAEPLGLRVVRMRTGLVLGPGSAALTKMTPLFKLFLGGRIGSGEQWFTWVHLDDVIGAYRAALTDERYTGPINLVAPDAIRQKTFAKALGKALRRPAVIPTPAFAARLALGEMAEYVLEGRKVIPRALEKLGFSFTRPTLADALRDL
jgi:uncharacterized protein (TIGR01777 family)